MAQRHNVDQRPLCPRQDLTPCQGVCPVGRFSAVELQTITYEAGDDGVAVVTLNRPERHNAFDAAMCDELSGLWRSLRGDDSVRCVVLTAAGDAAFCTGLDRDAIATDEGDWDFSPFTYEDPGNQLGPKSNGLWTPVVAAVNGMACGGAFYLLGEV